MSDDAIYNVA